MTETIEKPDLAVAPRVLSIDALRGFDMFWIVGGSGLAKAVLGLTGLSIAPILIEQMEHVAWEGFRFYDLIFPLFLFLVGCVLPYSLEKHRASPNSVYVRIARRAITLVLLGLVCNRILDFQFSELRTAGVLQRIGICYGIGALLCVHLRTPGQVIALVTILLGYWAILAWVPVPGGVAGDFSPEGNLCGYLDRHFLPSKIKPEYYGYGDNEGLLSTLPAIGTVLLGAIAGGWIKSGVQPWWKVIGLVCAGLVSLSLGTAWGTLFPIIKILWTSSFVLVAGGWSLLLLAFFYAVIDVIGWRGWSFFWVVIGANAITIYIVPRFVDFDKMAAFFLTGVSQSVGGWKSLVLIAGALGAKWLFLLFLYRQRIFLRL
jgi:predicted acyltransferase